jgi:putative DNA primase/helicase
VIVTQALVARTDDDGLGCQTAWIVAPMAIFETPEEYETGSGNADSEHGLAPSHLEARVIPFPTTASVPFMVTIAMEAELAARGYGVDQIRSMTPAEAHAILDPSVEDEPVRSFKIPAQSLVASMNAVVKLIEGGLEPRNITPGDVADMRLGLYEKKRALLLPLFKNPDARKSREFERTDLGNAEYFVELFGHLFRFDRIHERWLEWRNHRWEPNGRAAEGVQLAARRRLREATSIPYPSGQPNDDAFKAAMLARETAVKWAMTSERRYAIDSVLALADDMTKVVVSTDTGWDADRWLLGVPNGVVDLRDGVLRDGRQDDCITMHAGTTFDPDAVCPRWERFLNEVFDGDSDLVTYVRRAVGYTLTGEVKEDIWFGCYGSGQNGKSVLLKVLQDLFGDYAYRASFSLVVRSSGAESRRDFDTAYLHCKRLVVASEVREGGVWDEERLKSLTGRDSIHAEIKYGAEFNFWPSHKLWFSFNHLPKTQDHSQAFWRRARLIPFVRKFEGADCDLNLEAKLVTERAGILAWAVRAVQEWHQFGLQVPAAVERASKQYQTNEDPLDEFVARHVRSSGKGFYYRDAFHLYREWCKAEIVDKPFGKARFKQLLEMRGFTIIKKNSLDYAECGHLIRMCTCMRNPCVCSCVCKQTPCVCAVVASP